MIYRHNMYELSICTYVYCIEQMLEASLLTICGTILLVSPLYCVNDQGTWSQGANYYGASQTRLVWYWCVRKAIPANNLQTGGDTIPTVNSTPFHPKQLIWHDFVGVSLTHQHFQNHKTISAFLQLCYRQVSYCWEHFLQHRLLTHHLQEHDSLLDK